MTDSNRPSMRKRLREMKELADAAFWHVLDLRILIQKAEADFTTAKANGGDPRSGILGEEEHYSNAEDYQPDAGEGCGGEYR